MAGRTSTSSGKNRNQKRKGAVKKSQSTRRKKVDDAKKPLYQDIFLWIILALSFLLFLSNFGIGGVVGTAVSRFFFGLFGWMAYLFSIIILFGTFFAVSNRDNPSADLKLTAVGILYILLCALLELILHGTNAYAALTAYTYGVHYMAGGGLFGGGIASIFITWFGLAGAYIITLLLMIICLVLIFEKSVFSWISENLLLDSDESEERKEQKRQQMLDKRENQKKLNEKNQLERKIQREEEKKERQIRLAEEREQRIQRQALEHEKRQEALDLERQKRIARAQNHPLSPNMSSFEPDVLSILPSDEISEVTASVPGKDEKSIDVMGVDRVPLKTKNPDEKVPVKQPAEPFEKPKEEQPAEPEIVTSEEHPFEQNRQEKESDVFQPHETARFSVLSDGEEKLISKTPLYTGTSENIDSGAKTNQEMPVVTDAPKKTGDEKSLDENEKAYVLPPVSLLTRAKGKANGNTREHLKDTAEKLYQTLKNFGVNVQITDVSCGPTVTRYELQPEMGVKVSKILNLADDIKLNLAAEDIRIEAPIPGKAAIGIEVPNKEAAVVSFRELVESEEFAKNRSPIAFAAGRDIGGNVIISDIAKMPHLLIAGATGSGKSVCINTIIMSILYKANPKDVKFIMIDPKVVELSIYNGIPHLLIPVVTDPKKAAGALNWAVKEMTDRYKLFAEAGVRDMKGYNAKINNGVMQKKTNDGMIDVAVSKMPQIIVIVDELADLMMVSSNEVEQAICRLAQLARAAGIHLVIATQRPSVNVITGLIKANMPSRIAFSVTSNVDSRTILDMAGAEKLLGKGDMLYYPQGLSKPLRVQGAFVTDAEVQNVVNFLKTNNEEADYSPEIQESISNSESDGATAIGGETPFQDERDQYFEAAAHLIIEKEKGSIGMLQRYFKVGFNRAARIMDQLEEAGVVGPEEGTKPRTVLMSIEQFEESISS